jgi:hypothetical protein
MKSITEWLDMLKEPYRTEALEAFKKSGNNNEITSTGDKALIRAFNWAMNGGASKWGVIYDNFNDYIDTDGMLARDYNKIPRPIREEFERMSLRVLNKQQSQVKSGTRQNLFLSARFIVWKIRMETSLTQGGGYKVNDHVSPCLARMFEKNHPTYKGVFEKRKSKYDVTK